MTPLLIGLTIMLLLPILIDGLMLAIWAFEKKTIPQTKICTAKVSILVAARNEEANIANCIEGLLVLKYPAHLVEIFIGDDHSTDKTLTIAQKYAAKASHLKVIEIRKQLPGQQGKANVLAQLAQEATGDYLFFTDADTYVPSSWIEEMLAGFRPKVGLVAGVTGISGSAFWEKCQFMDWIFALGMVKVVNNLGYAVTALGNNMAVSRTAYEAVGGYENIPFSVTEDFELLKQIKKKGYTGNQQFHQGALAWSLPEPGWYRLLHQRKRWMKGAVQLPFAIVAVLGIQALFFPALVLMFFYNPVLAFSLLLAKILAQNIFIRHALSKVNQKAKEVTLILYEFYSAALSLCLMFFYLWPFRVNWKGRRY